MENKKLVKILLKDMGELEEQIAEIKANRNFDALEMEFVHTRAKGILQLLQMFDFKNEAVPGTHVKEPDVVSENTENVEKEMPVQDEKPVETEVEKEQGPEKDRQPEPRQEKPDAALRSTGIPYTVVPKEKDKNDEPADEPENDKEDDDAMLEEEIEKVEAVSRLGDSFLKGKSVNDLINDQNKLEFKLSNRPVRSIQSAIGINDRFLYIRELFDGDSQKFVAAVKSLDSKQNIKEAVDYLRNNFKWKRNETSLKFVNLVKRRFLND